ncbi:unnamed protein product [Spirodela intermedia]|uniref:Uncharacterized protein n=2 Tax=Spirodela intermedia TaxID=51605 RepID=A0A7I8LDZ1_SPIIN|nr:unnamed protein product [Spirodela intermedia]CAA6670438.1 unnamed protein product [Spirodela intermedia]CAA7407518.1 unnamed protein product [Spirodela intermedia]
MIEPSVILPIKDNGGGSEGSKLTVAFKLSLEAVQLITGTMGMFLIAAAGTVGSDQHLVWLFVTYITLFLFSLLVWILLNPESAPSFAQQHSGKLLAAAYLLRVLTLAFQAWCGLILLNHLGAAIPALLPSHLSASCGK